MSFTDAVVFIAAIIAVVAAGAFLGYTLRGRGQRQTEQQSGLQTKKSELYAEVIGVLDVLANADDRRKQWFIHRYYQGLVLAPDSVIVALNRYLDGLTGGERPNNDQLMEQRGQVVMAMRQDILEASSMTTKLAVPELYKIEVRNDVDTVEASSAPEEDRQSNSDRPAPSAEKASG